MKCNLIWLLFFALRYCDDVKRIDIDKLKKDFPEFNLAHHPKDPARTKIDQVAQSERDCSTRVAKKKGDKLKPRTLDPSLKCKDDFSLNQTQDGKISLIRTYWSKVGIKPLEQSEFCLITYNATHKSAQFCAPENREPDAKFKYVDIFKGFSLMYCLFFQITCSWHQKTNSLILQFTNLKCYKMSLKSKNKA